MKYEDFLKKNKGCPFCKGKNRVIIKKENAFLTYSLAPYSKDHLLIVPKRHLEVFTDLSNEELSDITFLEKEGFKILNKLGYINISLLYRQGHGSGKSIEHLHFHLIPDIILTDPIHASADRLILTKKQSDNLVKRIKSIENKKK